MCFFFGEKSFINSILEVIKALKEDISKQEWDLMAIIFLSLFITYLCIQVFVED